MSEWVIPRVSDDDLERYGYPRLDGSISYGEHSDPHC